MTAPKVGVEPVDTSLCARADATRIFDDVAVPGLTPRKQPIQRRAAATVEAILEGTAQLLEAEMPLSTNAIAERAGVSIGTLYQYFDGKDAVVVALSRRVRGALVRSVQESVTTARVLPLGDGLRAIVEAALSGDARRPALALALDRLEATLPLASDHKAVRAALQASLSVYLACPLPALAHHECSALADDLCAITGALTDAARDRGEELSDRLITRIALTLTALVASF